MKNIILNSVGSTLVNIMIAGAAVAAGGVYVMSTMQEQKTISKRAVNSGLQNVIRREIADNLSDTKVCLASMSPGVTNPVTADFEINSITNGTQTLYEKYQGNINQELYDHKIVEMKFELPKTPPYVRNDALHYQPSDLSVTLEHKDKKRAGQTIKIFIPLYTIMLDSKIVTCMTNESGSINEAFSSACLSLGGDFDEITGICNDLQGPNSMVNKYVKDFICSATNPASCKTHPYTNQSCTGPQYVDARGNPRGNWVVSGFDSAGQMECRCIPAKGCEDPSLYCPSQDLGTDWCSNDCGYGTSTDTNLCGSAPCTSWGSWTPDNSTSCTNQTVAQTRTCLSGGTATEPRTVAGTLAPNWQPTTDPSTVCNTATVTETDGCGNSRNTMRGTRNCCTPNWTPVTPLDQVCTTATVNQTDGCGNTGNPIYGTKACAAYTQTFSISCGCTRWQTETLDLQITPDAGDTCTVKRGPIPEGSFTGVFVLNLVNTGGNNTFTVSCQNAPTVRNIGETLCTNNTVCGR